MATYWENSCSFGLRYVSWYKYLIVSLVFSHLGFWSGNLFLIAPFPDLCLLVPFQKKVYPAPTSLISPTSANRVSLNAAICISYLPSSLPTRAVLRCGLSDPALSIKVRTFHAPIRKGITLAFFLISTA